MSQYRDRHDRGGGGGYGGRDDRYSGGSGGGYHRGRSDDRYGGGGGGGGGDRGGGGGDRGGYNRGRDDRRGGYGDRDRSRSRDDGGRGRGYGRGRGGGGRGGGPPERPRPYELDIKTNFYSLDIKSRELEVYQYECEVSDAIKVKKKDPQTGKFIEPWEFEYQLGKRSKTVDVQKAGILVRRIMKKLQNDHCSSQGMSIAFDGSNTIYSNKKLFDESEASFSRERAGTTKEGTSQVGKYGPSDEGGYNAPQATQDIANDFYVTVKKDCDENDPESENAKNAHFRIRLKFIAILPLSHILNDMAETQTKANEIKHAMDVMLKTSAFSTMYAPGKSPKRFYFTEDIQDELHSHGRSDLGRLYTDSRLRYAPFIGLTQAVKFCTNGVFVNTDTCVNFFDREHYYSRNAARRSEPPTPIPLLDDRERNIADVLVRDFHRPITDSRTRRDIEENIKNLTFHVKYIKKGTEQFRKRCLDKGWNEKRIEKRLTEVRRNCKIKLDNKKDSKAYGKSIIWSCDDVNEYNFMHEPFKPKQKHDQSDQDYKQIIDNLPPPVQYTLASYYKEKKGITLRFPHMPALHIGKGEWFPIEFCSQAFQKTKDANSDRHVKAILGYYDEHAGSRCVDNVSNIIRRLVQEQDRHKSDIFKQFSMVRNDQPLQLKAKVLPTPSLEFTNNVPASLRNGSWDLRDKRFFKGADLSAFCVIDGTNDRDRDGITRFMSRLFNVMERHEMELTRNVDMRNVLPHVTYHADISNPENMYKAFFEAINMAKGVFWGDNHEDFQRNKVFFKTWIRNSQGETEQAFITPPRHSPDNNTIGAIVPSNVCFTTHMVPDDNNNIVEMRLMYIADGILVDPFELRYYNHRYEVMDQSGNARVVRDVEIVYVDQNQKSRIPQSRLPSPPEPYIKIAEWQIDKPMVFVYMKEKLTQPYAQIKLMAQFEFGVPSQVFCASTIQRQRNQDQYCSNIALKCNAKLMNKHNSARAWNTLERGQPGIPWIKEVPTMVIGLDVSHGLGQDSISVIAATIGLDPGCMQFAQTIRVQSKSAIVSEPVMMAVIKNLYAQFVQHSSIKPVRLLLYRDGVSEGEFDRVLAREVSAVRQALFEIRQEEYKEENNGAEFPEKEPTLFNTMPITFVVAQSQHSIRIVPRDDPGGRDKNVPSGTVVDHTIMDIRDGRNMALDSIPKDRSAAPPNSHLTLFEDSNPNGYDFLMTSQGGLKGTSKPVFYRVLLNENAVWRAGSDATPLTKEQLQIATYYQAYQYGTATKAIRGIPVIYYSRRLANMAMSYVNYLRGKRERYIPNNDLPRLVNTPLEDNEEDRFMPRGRDGAPLARHIIVRADMANIDNIPPELKSEILLDFSPFSNNLQGELYKCPPFRPHLSA